MCSPLKGVTCSQKVQNFRVGLSDMVHQLVVVQAKEPLAKSDFSFSSGFSLGIRARRMNLGTVLTVFERFQCFFINR